MTIITEENCILDMANKILKLLNRFLDTNMTKEELRVECQKLFKNQEAK